MKAFTGLHAYTGHNCNESLYRLTCLHKEKLCKVLRGDCKETGVDYKNVLTHVPVTISTSFLQLSHLTFLLV